MEKNQQKLIENNCSVGDSKVTDGERTLILLKTETKRNIDQTINTPERYVSRYQYNVKNLDKYLQLCPHCKKPTLSAFERTVVDSATDYLNGKRVFKSYKKSGGNFLPNIILMFALGSIVYFILSNF
jgi:uncharacterized Rmd1/YagE family protein